MRSVLIILSTCIAVYAAPTDLERFRAWQYDTGRTTTSMTSRWSGESLDSLIIAGTNAPSAVVAIKAYTQAQVDSAIAAEKAAKDAEFVVIEPPTLNTQYGSTNRPIKEMYLSTNTLYIGPQPIKADADGIKLKASKTGSGWNPQGQIQARLEAIEKILGLRDE